MTAALRNSQSELREWARTLEQKVERRTEQLRIAQAEAARGEKLASVGLLASGIAHELNNPLTGVLTFSHLLREKMADGSQDAEDMDLVIRETRRCASIIRRLLDFAREKPPEKKFADLNQIIEDTARLVERPANLRDIAITLDLDRTLPPVWVDPDQIKQVVMNLLVNAQHAIDGEGSIIVRTRQLPQPRTSQAGAIAAPMVEFSVTDTGCGIPRENFRRIFDPFFTTKSRNGDGTGTVCQPRNRRGSWRHDRSRKRGGGGIHIPGPSPSHPVARSRGKRKQREQFVSVKILIVDDEQIIIDSCLRILRNDEYQLEAVQDGLEALRKIDENHYDIVILDIMMPKIDGLEVLRRVREGHPDIDVIMITGLSQIETAVKSMKLGAFDYLPKPFDPDELKLVVHRALERRRLLPGEPEPQDRGRRQVPLRERHRGEPADAERLPACRQVRADQLDGDAHRRVGNRQGTDRSRHSLQQPAQGQAVRSGGLQRAQRDICWRASCSATSRARSPARWRTRRACWKSPTAERCFSTKSAISPSRPRPSCCGSFRSGSSGRWGTPRRRPPTSD